MFLLPVLQASVEQHKILAVKLEANTFPLEQSVAHPFVIVLIPLAIESLTLINRK